MADTLFDDIPWGLLKKLQANLASGEKTEMHLKGAYNEILVCTATRVMILKSGWMTGQMFGSNLFQVPYSNIAGVEVKYGIMSGYFEISACGMQNTPKNYWSQDASVSPTKAPNCVSLNSRAQAARFRLGCAFLLERAAAARAPAAPAIVATAPQQEDPSAAIERIWKLKIEGALSESEYEEMKRRIIAGT